ncbi:MAG: hypothetical protein AAF513_01450 [Pseudomonadota bacterium]
MSQIPNLVPDAAVSLAPVHIPKPWGQEIWYTGMEARGESQVVIDEVSWPLSAYLAQHPDPTAGAALLLLKILDPSPDADRGSLYFEVHEEKQEVYVVTHIDPTAWPDGCGAIRFGMSQTRRAASADDTTFRAEYRAAVGAYEQIRRAIDDRAVDAETARPEESRARQHMESFTELRPLRVGDVVSVPTWTPHALQHGVRVVEFQTQTYERYIISFNQKVLTQDHWDTAHAVERMQLEAPADPVFEAVAPGVERIASFDDFNVWRVSFDVIQTLPMPPQIPYAVAMGISGEFACGDLTLQPGHACLIPHTAIAGQSIHGSGVLLLAAPDL